MKLTLRELSKLKVNFEHRINIGNEKLLILSSFEDYLTINQVREIEEFQHLEFGFILESKLEMFKMIAYIPVDVEIYLDQLLDDYFNIVNGFAWNFPIQSDKMFYQNLV